jgi:hypothetical protein
MDLAVDQFFIVIMKAIEFEGAGYFELCNGKIRGLIFSAVEYFIYLL